MKRLLLRRKGGHKKQQAWENPAEKPPPKPKRKGNHKKVQNKGDDDYKSASDEDYSDTQNERPSEYRKGGYHAVSVGELYNNRYRVVHKLGWGYFSTVWLVWDHEKNAMRAMKVQKSASHYRDAALDEIKLLSEIMTGDPDGRGCCARMSDSFEHRGPNGLHVCMVFEVLGENILKLIERYQYRGIPIPIVKNIMRQVLQGLAYIHSLNIIHTDLKPENVLFSVPPHKIQRILKNYIPPDRSKTLKLQERDPKSLSKSQKKRLKKKSKQTEKKGAANESAAHSEAEDEPEAATNDAPPKEIPAAGAVIDQPESETDPEWEVERIQNVTLADFGNGCWTYRQFTDEIQTRQYRSPEVILGSGYDCSADLWSAACMCFELITGEFLFDPKDASEYERDEDHLALMIEALGPMPSHMSRGDGKYRHKFLNSMGELRHIKELRYWPVDRVLHEKYRFTKKKAREIAEFLLPMLQFDPANRYTAVEMLNEFRDTFFQVTEDDYPAYCYVREEEEEVEEEESDNEADSEDDEDNAQRTSVSEDLVKIADKFGVTPIDISRFLAQEIEDFDADKLERVRRAVEYLLPSTGDVFGDEDDDDDDAFDEPRREYTHHRRHASRDDEPQSSHIRAHSL